MIVERPPCKQSLVALTQQVGVEFVHVAALLSADVALPRVGVAMAALVEEIQRRVWERDGAECADERRRQHSVVAVRRCDHAALRWRCSGSLQIVFVYFTVSTVSVVNTENAIQEVDIGLRIS